MKLQDTKEHTSGERLRQNRLGIDLAFLLGSLCFMFHNDVQYRETKHIFLQHCFWRFLEINNHICRVYYSVVGLKICTIHCSVISVETVLFFTFSPVIFVSSFSCPAFSCPAILMVRHFHVLHFQSTHGHMRLSHTVLSCIVSCVHTSE